MPQLQPYMFEPMRAVAEGEMAYAEDSEDDDVRFGNLIGTDSMLEFLG